MGLCQFIKARNASDCMCELQRSRAESPNSVSRAEGRAANSKQRDPDIATAADTGMEVTCKTLQDQRRYRFTLNHQATVADLIQKLKCELGASNEYTLICLGKMMQGRELVSSYGYSDLLPIIVMITSKLDLEHQEEEIR